MNAYLLTNHPDRFQRLASDLQRAGHHAIVRAVSPERMHLAPPVPARQPPGGAQTDGRLGLAIFDLTDGLDPVAAWSQLRASLGRPAIAVAFVPRDIERARAAFDAGFDEVLHEEDEADESTFRRWEKSLARLTGSDSLDPGQDPTQMRPKDRESGSIDFLDEGALLRGARDGAGDRDERIRAEKALRESEARFRDLADNMTQMAWMADENGSVFWYNRRWYDYTGTSFDEMRGQGWMSVHHPEHVARIVEKFRDHVQRGAPGEDTFPLRGADGRFRWFLTRMVPIRDEEGRIVRWLGTSTDVTDQKEATEHVERSRAQLEAVLQSVQDGIIVVDMQGRLVFANQAQARIAGLASADELERHLLEYIRVFEFLELDGTSVPLEQWPLARILRGEILTEWRLRGRERDTGKEWVFSITGQPVRDERGDPVLAVLVTHDATAQRKAEESLQETNALLQAIRESSTNTIYAKDRQGRLLTANPATLRALGKSEEEVIGKTEMDFLPDAESARIVMENDHRIMERGQPEIFEEAVRYPDGTVRTWLSTKAPYRDAHGNIIGLLGISHEITERKQAEDATRRERELLSRLIDRLPVMITLLDTRTGAFQFNEEFHRVLGWTNEDASREDIFALAIPDPAIRERGRNNFLTCPPGWHEFTILSKDGEPVLSSWAYLATEDMRVAIGIDLRERKQVEAALRESEVKLRALAESLPQIVWTGEPDGTVDYCNRRWTEYTGSPTERGHGSGWAAIVHPDDAKRTLEAWAGAVRLGSVYVCEHRLRRHDGAFRWFLSRGVPMKDVEGRVLKWFGTATDIDDQKRSQDQLSQARDQLELRVRERTAELEAQARQLERSNAELQRFAYLASHDLQEPLRIVVSYAQLLAKRYGECAGQEAEEFIDYMTSAARRMGDLIDDLLAYSRLESAAPRLQRVEMTDCVSQAVARFHDIIRSTGAEIAVGPLPAIEADEVLLGRLLDQLLGNALKFHSEKPPRIAISATQEDSRWLFSVRDIGIGIPKEFQAAVFEPFRRLHHWEEYPGTGIGLAVCRRIVESHGGRIWVESVEGGGSDFRFTIPVTPPRTAAAPEEERTVHEDVQ